MSVSTVPVVPGATINIEGTTVVTDGAGRASARACQLASARDVTGPPQPIVLPGQRRAVYDPVYLTGRGRTLQVAFGMDAEVSFAFSGLPSRRIESFTLRSSTGGVITRKDLLPVWLPSTRVLRGPDGLEERRIYYSVDSVYVEGSSVVNRSQVKFYPAGPCRGPSATPRVHGAGRGRRPAVPLARRDLGATQPPRHRRCRQPLENGVATFTEVPRGSYSVVAAAPGLRIDRSLILSRDQLVVMPVLTWVDLVVLLGLPLLIAVGLVLAPRPVMRRRLAAAVPRRLPRFRGPDSG